MYWYGNCEFLIMNLIIFGRRVTTIYEEMGLINNADI
jgi:hypothetical protein